MPKLLRLLLAVVLVGALGLAACGEFPFGGGSEERSMADSAAAMAPEPPAAMVETTVQSGRMSRDTATADGDGGGAGGGSGCGGPGRAGAAGRGAGGPG